MPKKKAVKKVVKKEAEEPKEKKVPEVAPVFRQHVSGYNDGRL